MSPRLALLAFVLLTKPDGSPIWVNPAEVLTVQQAHRPDWPAACRSAIKLSEGAICVREEPADVIERLGRE